MTHSQTSSSYSTPIAIVIAGTLIAGSIFLAIAGGSSDREGAIAQQPGADFRLPSESEHVRGNPDAKVAIIEFSDFECPFCAQLHPTLMRIVEENADVKWVFRHFPLSSIHSRALGTSIASECIARLGGNDAFWTFTDAVFADQRNLGSSQYENVVTAEGIDTRSFRSCLAEESVAAEVAQDGDEAVQAGGRGTPFVVIVTADGRLVPFSGALPYEDVKSLVDQALAS